MSEQMHKGWTKRHSEIVVFSGASPLIPNSSWSLLRQPLFAPVLPFKLWTSADLHSVWHSGFVRVSSDLHQHPWFCLGCAAPFESRVSKEGFNIMLPIWIVVNFAPLALHNYRATSWLRDLEIIKFCWLLETCYFGLYFVWNTLFYFLLYC